MFNNDFGGRWQVKHFDNDKFLIVVPDNDKIEWDLDNAKPIDLMNRHQDTLDSTFEMTNGTKCLGIGAKYLILLLVGK